MCACVWKKIYEVPNSIESITQTDHRPFGDTVRYFLPLPCPDNTPQERAPLCLVCTKVIQCNQNAFQCDGCNKWQHHACNTGFSRQQYLDIINGDYKLPSWYCSQCSVPDSHTSDDITSGTQSTILSAPQPNAESSSISVPEGKKSKHDLDMDLEPESNAHTDMNAQVRQRSTLPFAWRNV